MARRTQQDVPTPLRRWIGWQSAILPQVAERLFAEWTLGQACDMRQLMIVLPSSLAARRLNELLAIKAKQESKILYPPRFVTLGALPEQLYVAKRPFASDLVQHLAWMAALRSTPVAELKQVVPVPPAAAATQQWLELAKLIANLHRELASDSLSFEKVVESLGSHSDLPRWRALASIQRKYLTQLDALELWDIQTARLCALQLHEPSTSLRILVVGCVDLNRTQRGFLAQVAEQVEIWIAAPESEATYFDEFGGLLSSAWQDVELTLPDGALLVGNSPSDQAELACGCLAELGDRYHAREITLGIPDPSLIPELKHQLRQCSVSTRFGPGALLVQTEPAKLLSAIGDYIDNRSYSAFARLVRHPASGLMLQAFNISLPDDWLACLDNYYQGTLPKSIDGFVNEEVAGHEVYRAVSEAVSRWLAPLTDRHKPISQWVQPLLTVLRTAYDRQLCDLENPLDGGLYQAAGQISDAIVSLRDIPADLEPTLPVAELIDWLLRNLGSKQVPELADATAIEMLGWLELAFDDAPALIVAGMHDGVVPESVNSDTFLPNGLRRQLGMLDNSRRYARDAYFMQILIKSRAYLRIVVGKSDSNGDPLVPSRLLMACNLATLPDRILHLVQAGEADVLPEVEKLWKRRGGRSHILIPRPEQVVPPKRISVTAFRDYLACPYRFYLGHVLKLRMSHDDVSELDAPMFGNLLHDTLQCLGEGNIGSSGDEEELRRFLIDKLHQTALIRFGLNPPAAVLIQMEQAEERLSVFAAKQAERARDGWEIRFVEAGVDMGDKVMIGTHAELHLIGRIDRIDYHPATDRWAIWDYKTSDTAKKPVSVHWTKKDGWRDLQLPLYRPVSRRLGVGENPTLGYIALPKQASDIGFYPAEFTAEQLREADALANQIAQKVAAGEFWPEELASLRYDDFARICQENVQCVSVDPPVRRLHRHVVGKQKLAKQVVSQARELLKAPNGSKPKFQPLLIRASAGTGKTFQLTNRLLCIILSGQEVDHILASTFTRKAAGEIMHRVLGRLALGCVDAHTRTELERHLPDVDVSAPNCLAALRRVTRSIHRFRIGTLDSFFAQVARTFSLEMGLPPGWNALDPNLEARVQMQAIGRMLDNHDRKTLVELVRMLAKGETGRQVGDQIRQTVANGYTVFRATSSEAWDQLPLPTAPSESAVESALRTLEMSAIPNKSANDQLKKLALDAATGNWEKVIQHGIYGKLDEPTPTYYRHELSGSLIEALKLLVERAAAELLPIRRNQTLASYQVLEAYHREYAAMIRRQRTLAFSDVTHYLSRWMQSTSQGEDATVNDQYLAYRMDCGIQHLLLDEFQDTAPDQWQILQPLARPLGGEARAEQSFFCVGDTKQAIYAWRGGVAEIFDSVSESIEQLQQDEMRDSYRSSPEVLRAVNSVFQQLTAHGNFAGCDAVAQRWSHEFPEHRTSRGNLTGYVRLQNGPQGDSQLSSDENKAAYLEFTAQQIADLSMQSSATIGVLFRTNANVAEMISLLRDKGVSASQDGGNPLTDSVGVELVLSLLHLADHPGDRLCGFHLGTSPLNSRLPYSSLDEPFQLADWFRQEVSRRGLGAAVENIADLLADQLAWWDQHRLEQLIRAAYAYEPNFNGRLSEFEATVMTARVALPTEAQVKVMTIHKSKGLEFDAVFLPDLDIELSPSPNLLVLRGKNPCQSPSGVLRHMHSSLQAMLPADWQEAFVMSKERGVTESLCLLYVAMTRAKQALYLTSRPVKKGALQDFSSLLQSTLGAGQPKENAEAILYEDGNSQWFLEHPRKSVGDARSDQQTITTRLSVRTDLESSPVRGLRVTAPSEATDYAEPVPLAYAFSFRHAVEASYGTIIHALFEQVEWLDEFVWDRQRMRQIAMSHVDADALRHLSLDQVLDDFQELLQLSSVRTALGRDRYRDTMASGAADSVEIDNERVISVLVDKKIIQGSIDRLAVITKDGRPQAAEIFDFKTDRFTRGLTTLWLEERVAKHRHQMAVYAQTIAELLELPREKISTYLVMLSTDDIVRVNPLSDAGTFSNDSPTSTESDLWGRPLFYT